MVKVLGAMWLIVAAVASTAAAQTGFYLIGNSLTQDTIPTSLPGAAQYHIDCGTTLKQIYDNPSNPCVGTSTIWPTALANRQFSVLMMQPFGHASPVADVLGPMREWIDSQSSAEIVIHTAWPLLADVATEYVDPSTTHVRHSGAFMDALKAQVEADYPGRRVRMTYTHAMIYAVYLDCLNDAAPFGDIGYLYRDAIHLTYGPTDGSNGGAGSDGAGRYLAHNAVRRTLGLPYETPSTCTASAAIRAYLRQKIEAYHGPPKTDGVFNQ